MVVIRRQIFFVLILLAAGLYAQESRPSVADIQRAYDSLKFDEAEKLARQAMTTAEAYAPGELVQIHLLLGYIEFTQKQNAGARQHFESALSLQPGLELDSLLVSPRIVRFFEQVKNEYRVGIASGEPAVKYIVVKDQRLAALRRSLVLPGWGQRHLQRPRSGWIYTIGFLTALGAGLSLHLLQDQAHDRYLAALTPEEIAREYDAYNQRYRLRNAALAAAAGIYAVNIFDLMFVSSADPSIKHPYSEAAIFGVSLSLPLAKAR